MTDPAAPEPIGDERNPRNPWIGEAVAWIKDVRARGASEITFGADHAEAIILETKEAVARVDAAESERDLWRAEWQQITDTAAELRERLSLAERVVEAAERWWGVPDAQLYPDVPNALSAYYREHKGGA